MSRVLQCPHFISYGGLTRYCMLGHFLCDCENCNCPDKRYVDITTSTNANSL